ncbi:MAG: TAXI family TRAP transporter solute-binding subunit, partial [Ktedonobacteraceae bacterium]
MAFQGHGPYTHAHSNLRAIAALPHRDRLLFAIDADVADRYGLVTFADIVAKRPPLRIATGYNDGINVIGYAVDKVLKAYGTTWEALEQWGGRWFVTDTPFPALTWFATGAVDALFHEAMMIWPRFLNDKAVRYLSLDPTVLETLRQQHGYRRADLQPGDLPGVEQRLPTVDFSQWVIIVRDDLPEEVAYLMAQVIVEDRADFEARYHHLPVQASPLYYPMRPEDMCRVEPIPLHPGAMRYYRERGFLAEA